jgi:HSP20 family protein
MTTLVRWDPFREVASLQNDMSRLMSTVFGVGGNGESRTWIPAVDAWETEDEIIYAFDLPGIPEDKVAVEFDESSLTVSGERERKEEVSGDRMYRYERRFGTFSRAVGLPQGVSEEDINASFTDGVLEVRVPKPSQSKPRRVPVGTGAQAAIEGESKTKK